MELQGRMNQLAGTWGLGSAACANLIANTSGLDTVGALNVAAGRDYPSYLDVPGVFGELPGVGVAGLDATSLQLPGSSGNYVSCPYQAALGITGDIDVRWVGALDDWTPGGYNVLVGRYDTSTTQRCWMLTISASDGYPTFYWSTNGSSFSSAISTVAPTVSDGESLGIRATLDVDNGADGYTVTFYTSDDAGATWDLLDSVTAGSPTSIYGSVTAPLEVGSRTLGTANHTKGKVERVEVRDGIGGTVVASPDFSATRGPRFYDDQGNLFTINGSASEWV